MGVQISGVCKTFSTVIVASYSFLLDAILFMFKSIHSEDQWFGNLLCLNIFILSMFQNDSLIDYGVLDQDICF